MKITYFISDLRIKWETNLEVNINDDGSEAEVEAYIVVDNQTGFTYDDVELGFAIFELPGTPDISIGMPQPSTGVEQTEMMQNAFQALNKQKKTQRMRNLML